MASYSGVAEEMALVAGRFAGVAEGVVGGLSGGLSGVAEGVAEGVAGGLSGGLSGVAEWVAEGVAGGLSGGLSGVAEGVAEGVAGWLSGVAEGVAGGFSGVAGELALHSGVTVVICSEGGYYMQCVMLTLCSMFSRYLKTNECCTLSCAKHASCIIEDCLLHLQSNSIHCMLKTEKSSETYIGWLNECSLRNSVRAYESQIK